MTMAGHGEGFTIKELLLQVQGELRGLDGKLDGFIAAHASQHTSEVTAAIEARSDPRASPAGRALKHDIDNIAGMVRAHDRALQRVYGALTLVSFLGGAAFVATLLRLAGLTP
jgi:hypothetical protein